MKSHWVGDILAGAHDGETVELKGWVYRTRGNNNIHFLSLRDSTGNIKCVAKKDITGEDAFAAFGSALIESSLIVRGEVVLTPDSRDGESHEILVTSLDIVGSVDSERPFPIKESDMLHTDEEGELMYGGSQNCLDNRHLYLRTTRATTMLKLRSTAFGAIHDYFRSREFIEYQAPNFVTGAVEGGSTLFEVPYFPTEANPERKAYLTQSWQLYAEAAMPALERLYTIAPSFRAEDSRTRRHLTEFWHAEMEMAWANNDEVMEHGEGVVRHIAQTMLDEREQELVSLDRDLESIAKFADNPYPRMRYDEAIERLQELKVDVEWGDDLDYTMEKVLTQDFEIPHFVTHYPKIAKPFYHRVDPEDGNYVLCHDLLAPEGYGEIIGGGERTWSEREILERIDEENTPREPYQFYIDVRSYGGVPHAGFGLGVDRVVSWLAGATHIREVIPFPRTSRRVTP